MVTDDELLDALDACWERQREMLYLFGINEQRRANYETLKHALDNPEPPAQKLVDLMRENGVWAR